MEGKEEDGKEEVARGWGWGGWTVGRIMEQIKLSCIAWYSGPPSEILPTVQLGTEAEGNERMEEDGEEEVAWGRGGVWGVGVETDGGIMEQIKLYCTVFRPTQ